MVLFPSLDWAVEDSWGTGPPLTQLLQTGKRAYLLVQMVQMVFSRPNLDLQNDMGKNPKHPGLGHHEEILDLSLKSINA